MTRFSSLAKQLSSFGEGRLVPGTDPEIQRACFDSRLVRPGDLFCALPSANQCGRAGLAYLPQAIQAGAAAVLHVSAPLAAFELVSPSGELVPEFRVDLQFSVADVAGRAAHLLASYPAESLWVGAVTGTNGKSTVVHLMQAALSAGGVATASIGTLGMHYSGCDASVLNTTPSADLIAEWLKNANKAGARALAIEASSHGLDQRRLAGLPIDAAAWTNLTHDHLDYHDGFADYAQAKARLVHSLDVGAPAFLPAGNERILKACEGARAQRLTWGFDDSTAAIRGRFQGASASAPMSLAIAGELGQAELQSGLVGQHNAENLLVAWSLLRVAGLSAELAAEKLGQIGCAPGRLERVAPDSGMHLFVDYAHTPDALCQVLRALRESFPQATIGLVFGAGGDRDAAKRAPMGIAAAQGSDWCLVTSDNPRTEDPRAIADAVALGVAQAGAQPEIQVDRRSAIREALLRLKHGDVLLVAGKGHEPYQEVDGVRHHFDDREEVLEAVQCLL
jgi:UDP-N-acetylmuramoyl-L-alanyl-D-glutamate--2,6-diaminopimelate ligase